MLYYNHFNLQNWYIYNKSMTTQNCETVFRQSVRKREYEKATNDLGLGNGFRRVVRFPTPITTGLSPLNSSMVEKVMKNEIPPSWPLFICYFHLTYKKSHLYINNVGHQLINTTQSITNSNIYLSNLTRVARCSVSGFVM